MPLLSQVSFGSHLVYSPRGVSDISQKSRSICRCVKEDSFLTVHGEPERAIPFIVRRLKAKLQASPLQYLLTDNIVFVPAPRSSPLQLNSLDPPQLICDALTRELGHPTMRLLERTVQVPKAAFSKPADRPKARQHYETIRAIPEMCDAEHIILVDDVITRGSMTIGCASRLAEAHQRAKVSALAIIRTMSQGEVATIEDICAGAINLIGEDCFRTP